MKRWKSFDLEGVRYDVDLNDANDGILVEAYSTQAFRNRQFKCYVRAVVEMGGVSDFHADKRTEFPEQTCASTNITEIEFTSDPSYIGLRAAFNLGVEEAKERLRKGAR